MEKFCRLLDVRARYTAQHQTKEWNTYMYPVSLSMEGQLQGLVLVEVAPHAHHARALGLCCSFIS